MTTATERVDYLICGDYVLTMNESLDVLHQGAVAVRGDAIVDVGDAAHMLSRYSALDILDGRNRVILPGLVNAHTHAAMVYFRGLADDLPLRDWLEHHIWPAENRWLSPAFVEDAVSLACLEMLKAGVTTYNDMYFFGDSAARASRNLGMRAVLGAGILDFPSASAGTTDQYFLNAEEFAEECKGDDLITPCIAPHALYTCGAETLVRAKDTALRLGVPMHIHLSETEWEVKEIVGRHGKRPLVYLDSIGFFGGPAIVGAHCVWVDDEEIAILAARDVGVAHCVESNLKLASGFAPVPRMVRDGVKVGFGTDGAASNNDLDVLSEMSTAAKVHKAICGDPTALDARTVVRMATRWGAEILGLGGITGSIEKGKRADIVSVNIRQPHLMPLYDIYSHIVYSARSSDVEDVMVNGRLVIRGRRHFRGLEQEILGRAEKWGMMIKESNCHSMPTKEGQSRC